MKPNSNPITRLFRIAKGTELTPLQDDVSGFGPEAGRDELKKVKGGFGDVKGDVCVNAPGATGNTHIEKK